MATPDRKPEVLRSNFYFNYGIALPVNPTKKDMLLTAAVYRAIGATMCAKLCERAVEWLEV